MTTVGRDGIAWIVAEMIRWLIRGRLGTQYAVAKAGVRESIAVQVVLRRLGPRERPLLLVTPLVRAHDEDLDRRFSIEAVRDAFEVVVEPLHRHRLEVDLHILSKIDVAVHESGVRDPRD